MTVDGHHSPVSSPTKNHSINASPNMLKLTKSFDYLLDESTHERNNVEAGKMMYQQQEGDVQPQLMQTTTVTTKKIVSIQHNIPTNLSQNPNFLPAPPRHQINPNPSQKTMRHSFSPNHVQHTVIDKQFFHPLNINTQTHIYHHVLPPPPHLHSMQ